MEQIDNMTQAESSLNQLAEFTGSLPELKQALADMDSANLSTYEGMEVNSWASAPLPRRLCFCLFVCELPTLLKKITDCDEFLKIAWQWYKEQLINFRGDQMSP